ncbi:unnamed protein product [Zymoseptoria tritici ST99CH_1A5]|nr:unnamed protein product [Zymoseptoria tritici ST99CH_1E4]SMR51476.1 unnamed protein product [Zymoseptoria tritici ST99CH_3D1]SMY23233.1 unnamed protein product [Zymoseptoria tritici ST99CH_1A5]
MAPDAEDASPSPEPGADHDSSMMADEKTEHSSEEKSPTQTGSSTTQSAKSNAKDPSRSKRKKARRACFACQRAHLTCGDERPCLRCIKRGLQDQCHDGVRKKAKYLHDAPAEALVPGFSNNFAMSRNQNMPSVPAAPMSNGLPVSQPGAFYPQSAGPSYPQYGSSSQQNPMGPPMLDGSGMVSDFASSAPVEPPSQFQATPNQQTSPAQDLTSNLEHTPSISTVGGTSFDTPYFDPNDPALFNFNISELNFGNHYGALEFGMLGHMSSGAVNTPELDGLNSMGQHNQRSVSYDGSNAFTSGYNYNQGFPSWQNAPNSGSRHGSAANAWTSQNNALDAFAIGEQGSITGASPHSQNQDYAAMSSPETQYVQPEQTQQSDLLRQSLTQAQQNSRKQPPFPGDPSTEVTRKRGRNTSEVYTSVQAPYSYTLGFHALTAFLQKRFPANKVLRIAKALATIRPSFISCNQHLNHDDLIFMEKCFQRTLFEYEDLVGYYGTPTVICRRTGEVAAVSKEFCLVTGWKRDVLLGKEPNLNVNTGDLSGTGTQTGASSKGTATPRVPRFDIDPGRPQPVFLAELMDEDSVVQFFDDFAELAFRASRTSVIGEPCSLLKYRTKDHPGWSSSDTSGENGKRHRASEDGRIEPITNGESGMNALGDKDGKVDCVMCWHVKRDVFDIPMLIVMNFLPKI